MGASRSRAGSGVSPAGDPRAGFLLIEVVAALALTLLVLAFAFPFTRGTTALRMRGVMADVVVLLRDTRTAAIASAAPRAAVFDTDRRMLRGGSQAVGIPADVAFSIVAGGNCPADATRSAIVFRPDGSNCGGVLRFVRRGSVSEARVNWVDGHVDVVGSL